MFEPRNFPFPKRFLLRVHHDLAKVKASYDVYFGTSLADIKIIIILLEDKRFLRHWGVDIKSVFRELFRLLTFRRHGGASTIDMQFVRTMTGYKERTLKRKIYEMLLAYLLQFRMGKLDILRSYLAVVYLGSGISGISRVARIVFNKEIWFLNEEEAAFIAAMMVYPRSLNPPSDWRRKVERRAAYGLRLFRRYGRGYK
jgi:membrane peptidoglycan carboxypeptidase